MYSVLVPVDGSPASLRAVALALREVHRSHRSALHLLNVQAAELHDWPGKQSDASAMDAELHRQGVEVLEKAREMTQSSGLRVETHVRAGHVAGEIVSCAEASGCDAIVMGTRGMGTAAGEALGSVAARVVHLSRLPVTLVK
jgi:nucleotide-binding universal stress UspA family protein